MSETEIALLNERVARAMGWTIMYEGESSQVWISTTGKFHAYPPDFYHDIRLVGEMLEWLNKNDSCFAVTPNDGVWYIDLMSANTVSDPSLPAALCRAIDAVAKGTP